MRVFGALVVVALVGLLAGCGDGGAGDGGGSASEAVDAGPSYVESEACRAEGADLLDDAEAVLTAETANEVSRYAKFVRQDHFPSCAGAPVNALAHVVDTVDDLDQEASNCLYLASQDGTGLDCSFINGSFAKVNRMIDEARAVLEATSTTGQ